MFHPVKAIKTEIKKNQSTIREIRNARRYARMIRESQAKLEETKLVPGYTKIYA